MTFVPKSFEIEHNLPSHWIRSVYHLEKLELVVYYLGRERGFWSRLRHKLSPWEAVLVLDERLFSPCMQPNTSKVYQIKELFYVTFGIL